MYAPAARELRERPRARHDGEIVQFRMLRGFRRKFESPNLGSASPLRRGAGIGGLESRGNRRVDRGRMEVMRSRGAGRLTANRATSDRC